MKRKKNSTLSSEIYANPKSVRVRVKRTTVESSYVHVPLTKDLIKTDNCIDIASVFDKALHLESEADVQWHFDYQETEVHPEQGDDDPFNE